MEKILYIITQSDWGGAQRYVFDLSINLQKSQGYEIHVAAGYNGPLLTHLEAPARNAAHSAAGGQKLLTVRLKHLIRPISPYHDLMAYFELKKLLCHIKPDVVHLNSSKAGFIGALAAKSCGIKKIIYTAHGFVFNEPLPAWKKWLYKKIELASSKRIDKIICVSEYDKQTGLAAGIEPDKLITIHNGIDVDAMNFLSREDARVKIISLLNYRNSEIPKFRTTRLIGCIANFYPTKSLDILIQAMKNIDANLIIIGAGPENKKLKLTAYSLQLEKKVFFAGSIPNAATYLKAFDLFVLPSRKEGLPYVLLEAAAAGVPIVATQVGGVPEIIKDGQNGYLAKPNDINDLTDKINHALAHTLPPILANDFTLTTMLAKTLTAYSS